MDKNTSKELKDSYSKIATRNRIIKLLREVIEVLEDKKEHFKNYKIMIYMLEIFIRKMED